MMADETTIEVVAAPADSDPKYQFFKNTETGQMWKASVDLKTARNAMLSQTDIEAAPVEMAISVTVSPVDDSGKALRDDDNKPIIIDSLTHTFTAVEMSQENFDPEFRIMGIVAERIHTGQARLSGFDKLNELIDNWNKKGKLKAKPTTYVAPSDGGTIIPGNLEVIGEGAEPLEKPVDISELMGSTIHRPAPVVLDPEA